MKVRADGRTGAGSAAVTERATYQHPVWAPDGRRIVVVRGPAEPRRIEDGPEAPGTAIRPGLRCRRRAARRRCIAPYDGAADEPHFSRRTGRGSSYYAGRQRPRFDPLGRDRSRRSYLKVTASLLLDPERAHPRPDAIIMSPGHRPGADRSPGLQRLYRARCRRWAARRRRSTCRIQRRRRSRRAG